MSKARILIAEDEALIAMMLEDFVDALDCKVAATVDTVDAALTVICPSAFDAAILDVNLKDGEPSWPIADALDAAGIPFIFTSGGDRNQPPQQHRDKMFITKPFSLEMLEKALHITLPN
jgi:CheY-like chemotaxis protein